jgi:hypothetical protein
MQQIWNITQKEKVIQVERFYLCILFVVRTRGLEPPQDCSHYHLKVARLPFRHVRVRRQSQWLI